MKLFTTLKRDEGGTAVIELALVAPVLALVVIGIVDISNAYSRKLALEQGAQRAIEKIMQTTGTSTVQGTLKTEAVCQVNGMNTNGSCKSTPITQNNVTVTFRLECVGSGGSISQKSTTTDATAFDALTCPSNTREARYVEVHLTDKYEPMFPVHFGTVNGFYNLTATAGVRTE